MKKIALFASLAFLISCGPDYKSEVERMMHERDSLMAMFDSKDSSINGYMLDIMNIQMSLDSLTMQEQVLMRNSGNESTKDNKERVQNSIRAIRELINENKKKITELQAKIRKSNIKMAELENLIKGLNAQIYEKDSNLMVMNEKVNSLNTTITSMKGTMDTMQMDITNKTQEINDKTSKLHTAYYTVGTYKQLRDKKVIAKKGGFIGIGKSKSMVPDFNKDAFTKIDYTTLSSIPVNSKDVKMVSTHPSGTYKIQRENNKVKSIEITDPENFWKASKYLVVVTD